MRGLAYSPDGCLLAVAQSDAAVFVYRLGATWGEPKAICNRFAAVTPATCLVWPASHAAGPMFGCADGQVGHRESHTGLRSGDLQIAYLQHPPNLYLAVASLSPFNNIYCRIAAQLLQAWHAVSTRQCIIPNP